MLGDEARRCGFLGYTWACERDRGRKEGLGTHITQSFLQKDTFLKILFTVLGIEPRASHMLSKCWTTEPHPRPCKDTFFVLVRVLMLKILFCVLWSKELILTSFSSCYILPHHSQPLASPSSSIMAKGRNQTMIDWRNYSLCL